MILRGIGVAKRNVADDAERDERHLIYITRLRDGSRLHVYGLGLGEVPDNLAHLLFRIDKPVARDDEALMDSKLSTLLQQPRVGLEPHGHALHLSILGGVVDGGAAIHVVIAQLGAHHHVLHVDVVAIPSGTTTGDNHVGMELIDHALSPQGGVHLAYSTLLHHHVSIGK